ncbi:MAG: PorP/SprF family type IX secretion system membrane protein [Bacteroidota bacterium]
MKASITICSFIVFVLLSLDRASAQQTPVYSQYFVNPYVLNPATAGENGIQAFFHYRNQWVKIEGSPETYVFTLDGKLKNHPVGLGITFLNDATNVIDRTNLGISSSYFLRFSQDHHLSFGMTFKLIQNKIDFTRIVAADFSDPNLLSSIDQSPVVDASAGLRYTWNDLKLGIVVDQLLQNEITYEDAVTFSNLNFSLVRHYTVTLNYNVALNEKFSVEPIFINRVAQGLPSQYDAGLIGKYKNVLWLGSAYRHQIGWSYSFGLNALDNLSVGYTYEISSTGLPEIGGATHELVVGWRFGESLFSSPNVRSRVAEQKETPLNKDWIKKLRLKNQAVEARLDSISEVNDLHYKKIDARIDSIKRINDFQQEEIDALNEDFLKFGQEASSPTRKENENLSKEQEEALASFSISSKDYIPAIIKNGNILFSTGSYKIEPKYRRKLDELIQWLLLNESIRLKLIGHSDASGNPLSALKLSENRVQAVKNYLTKKNISENRISTEVKGSTDALSHGDIPNVRMFNRRVEIKLDN